MNHDVRLEGYGALLRPVTMEDAESIVNIRRQKHARGFIGDISDSIPKQRAWLQQYFERPDEYYWMICNQMEPTMTLWPKRSALFANNGPKKGQNE